MAKGPTVIREAGFYYNRYDFEVETGVSLDDALQPSFWAHVGARFKEFDRLTLLAQDKTWTADVIVLAAGTGFAKVKLLYAVDLTDNDAPVADAEDEMEVKYNGPSDRYVVIRKKDNVKLQTGFATKGEALAAAANHVRVMA